jgi:hypothetical protein
MGVITLVEGLPQWRHGWGYWGYGPSLLPLLVLPALVAVLGLLVSAGRAVANHGRRWRPAPAEPRPSGSPEASAGRILASEADREQAVASVTHAVAEARLSLEEGTERIDGIWISRYRHELDALIDDLPGMSPPSAPRRVRLGILIAVAATVVAAAMQWALGVWELWPVAVAISFFLGARR